MTQAEAVERVARLLWGLRFVENRLGNLEPSVQVQVRLAAGMADNVFGAAWRDGVQTAEGRAALARAIPSADPAAVLGFFPVANQAVHDGFASLRDETDQQLIAAEHDAAWWAGLYTFFSAPQRALGLITGAVGGAAATGVGSFLGGLFKSPAGIVVVVVLALVLTRKK